MSTTWTSDVLSDVLSERNRQDRKWGEQNHKDGTARGYNDVLLAQVHRERCQANGPADDNWRDILQEEVSEAFAECDQGKLRAELVQVAAVAVAWIECIDRREAAS